MRTCRSLLALLLFVPAGLPAEIQPLKGEPIKGEVVSVSDKEVVYLQDGKKVTRPIKEVLKIEFRDVGKLSGAEKYSLVELTDGTQLLASKVLMKKKEFELKLLAGPEVKLPGGVVANVLLDATTDAYRRDWKTRVFNTRGKEAIVTRNEKGGISNIIAALGEGDESGTAISYVPEEGAEARKGQLAKMHGLIFKHALGPKAMPVVCKLLDTLQDVVMVSSVTPTDGGLTVTTPAGAKIEFKNEQLARLDYTKGKLEYLSDLEPTKVVVRANLDEEDRPDQWHVYKDSSLNKKPLSVGGVTYSKGLALLPYAELVYDLRGQYREFEAVVGIDDEVRAAGGVVLVVEADGKELASVTVAPEDKKRARTVTLNVKDAQKLRIVVRSDGEFDVARHLDLADAKVRKD
jgi:hypothetical protein